jgi:hypothetical protein
MFCYLGSDESFYEIPDVSATYAVKADDTYSGGSEIIISHSLTFVADNETLV